MHFLVCPGQGSQTPGFLTPWLSTPGARELIEVASTATGLDLLKHGTESDADTIRDTAIAQPLIVTASIISYQALIAELPAALRNTKIATAGHSVGEFAAAVIAGILSPADALRLVAVRAKAMAAAAAEAETGMAAVVGGVAEQVAEKIAEHGLVAANQNGGGQVVAAGSKEKLAALAADAPRGARVIPLQVAGAFHTAYMASAVPVLQEAAEQITPQDPSIPIYTNADGRRVESGSEFLKLLVGQVSSPVRWDACMESFQAAGIASLTELTPAGALSGIAKRALRGVPAVAVKTPADLPAAVAQLTGTGEEG